MERSHTKPGSGALKPADDPTAIILARKTGVTLLDKSPLDAIMAAPLPGIVIFVHGVNSDGEWYKAAEEGLCKGLNDRLKRRDEHMAYATAEGGQLTPATYMPELTDDGYLQPEFGAKTFLETHDHFTPVIRFRWGYKSNAEELQEYGDSIYLNEHNYWGGGPFANGCSALPDLWSEGLSASLFLWLNVEHINPDPGRQVFSCPHRSYFVLAALRLAKLVEAIRKKQADVPITIVCHSQGNMVGIAAAFLGDRMEQVADTAGIEGRCVADNYVLCNPPYSLASSNFTEDWGDRHMTDREGGSGRQTVAARIATLRAFFDIIRRPASPQQKAESIDKFMANYACGFNIAEDRKRYGFGLIPSTCCRVTLYCNPHDQVISATPIQGIGWRGMSAQEVKLTGGTGLFCQRVFAQGFKVGAKGNYDFWSDHWKSLGDIRGSQEFWSPRSRKAEYSLSKGLASTHKFFGWVLTIGLAPVLIVATKLAGVRINALPPNDWKIPVDAPELDSPFTPRALRFGQSTDAFDEGFDALGQYRDQHRVRTGDDPYAGDRPIDARDERSEGAATDASLGDRDSEANLRYEDHARLRMLARREGIVAKGQQVVGEDRPDEASADYTAWRNKKIKGYLADNVNAYATDHSTILTNPMHSEKALAYDVAIGMCHIRELDWHELRKAADWRLLKGLDNDDTMRAFHEYFKDGNLGGRSASEWLRVPNSEGSMPEKIADQREHRPHESQPPLRSHP
jgi:hypothetical protein